MVEDGPGRGHLCHTDTFLVSDGPGVSLTLCCFVVYSTRRFVIGFACYYLFLCFSVLWALRLPRLGKERANLSTFHAFVRFALVWVCRLSLGVWEGLRLVIVTHPGLFAYLLIALPLGVISRLWPMNDATLDILYSHFSGSNWISVNNHDTFILEYWQVHSWFSDLLRPSLMSSTTYLSVILIVRLFRLIEQTNRTCCQQVITSPIKNLPVTHVIVLTL